MTVTSEISSVSFAPADGVQSSWPFNFLFYAREHIQVWITPAGGTPTRVFSFVLTLGPSPSGQRGYEGGTVTFTPAAGTVVEIRRVVPFTQTGVNLRRASGFDPLAVMQTLDEGVMRDQQLRDGLLSDTGVLALVEAYLADYESSRPRPGSTIATYRIPEDYATLNEAFDALYLQSQRQRIQLRMSTGYVIPTGVSFFNGDWSGFIVSSVDATVPVSSSFTGPNDSFIGGSDNKTGQLFMGWNARMPALNCVIDMGGRGASGYYGVYNCSGYVYPDCGVINAGYMGLVARGSIISAYKSVWNGARSSGIRSAHGSTINAQNAQANNCAWDGGVTDPDAEGLAAIDVSRNATLHFRSGSATNSGGGGANIRRASAACLEEANFSNCAGIGVAVYHASRVSVWGANIRYAGGPALLIESASVADARGADCRNSGASPAVQHNTGATIALDNAETDAGTPGLANVTAENWNVTSNRGIIYNFSSLGDMMELRWNRFSATGVTNGKDITGDGSILQSSRVGTSSLTHQQFYNSNGLVGSISTSGSSTVYATSSDERKKTITGPVGPVTLPPVVMGRFNVEAPGTERPLMTAQSILPLAPHAVVEDESGFYQVDYSALVPLLVAKIAELEGRLEALE